MCEVLKLFNIYLLYFKILCQLYNNLSRKGKNLKKKEGKDEVNETCTCKYTIWAHTSPNA